MHLTPTRRVSLACVLYADCISLSIWQTTLPLRNNRTSKRIFKLMVPCAREKRTYPYIIQRFHPHWAGGSGRGIRHTNANMDRHHIMSCHVMPCLCGAQYNRGQQTLTLRANALCARADVFLASRNIPILEAPHGVRKKRKKPEHTLTPFIHQRQKTRQVARCMKKERQECTQATVGTPHARNSGRDNNA